MITILWNDNKEEAQVHLSAEFINADRASKLDLLSDAIADLTKRYDAMLEVDNA